MLVNLNQVLPHARQEGFAVGAFNVSNTIAAQAIIEAAENQSAPVIIQATEKSLVFAGIKELALTLKTLCQESRVPTVLHFDHGRDKKIAKELIELGFTSLMLDNSNLPLDKNIHETKEIADIAKRHHLSVEGEVGRIAGKEDYIEHKSIRYTDPKEAVEFVEKTGVDALAIAFGNAHGQPQPGEKLNFEVLSETAKLIKIPLVFHGASNTQKSDIKKAIEIGVAKINIDTELKQASTRALRRFLASHPEEEDPRAYFGAVKEAVREAVSEKIDLFGSSRKA